VIAGKNRTGGSSLRVIRNRESGGERVLALGTFDGVHRGHQALLKAGKQYAQEHSILLRACSFDRHPLEVLKPEIAPKLLNTPLEKAVLMARYGADELQLLPFTKEMADMEPEEFLCMLCEKVGLRAVVAGWNYTFGKGGKGDAELLQKDGREHGYDVLIVPPVMTDRGEIISSTLIRKKLQEGLMGEAETLMGHPYELHGRVTDGKHIGHQIGVPTANIRIGSRKQLPAFGVYPCRMITTEGENPAAVNIGIQPTIPSGGITVEAHVLDGKPELYGRNVRLIPGDRIRPERKFDSVEALTAQIREDQEVVRKWYASNAVIL